MYGIYGDIISAAEKALGDYGETKELLEYPEVQADKAYYLSVLSKFRALEFLNDKLTVLKKALDEEKELFRILPKAESDSERSLILNEISLQREIAAQVSCELSDALCHKPVEERVYCRLKLKQTSSRFGATLFALIKSDLLSRGAKVENESKAFAKEGYLEEISFTAEGERVLARLSPFKGSHKVYIAGAKSEELCFAVTPSARIEEIDENDLKIDVFHSHGAGGQNINKVETAVRVTHLPTGLSVVCQDERSQLKNKKRALETIEKRLTERSEKAEKKRIEADISAQYSLKNTPVSFDTAGNTITDTRLKSMTKIPFPMTEKEFASYINGLMAL